MACGITSDYIYQRMKSTEKDSEKGFAPNCALLLDEDESGEVGTSGDKEEVKGGADGR
jgi:hypothetical protein